MTARPAHPLVSLVVPVFNEETCVADFVAAVRDMARDEDFEVEIVFVNDGSTDGTFERLRALQATADGIAVVNLTRNFGKEAAVTAGLAHAGGDAVVPMDVDLQHPPEAIPRFVGKWRAGADVVAGRRVDRQADGWLRRAASRSFYRTFNRLAGLQIPGDVGDYRLMDRRVAEAILSLGEGARFMKGIFAWVGYRTEIVDYEETPRRNGRSKFGLWRLWNFALDGILSFSTVPLRVWTYIGVVIALVAFLYGSAIVARTLVLGVDTPGYASLISVVLFLGGVQLISLGIIGEYVGRIAMQVKQRPLFLVENVYRREAAAPSETQTATAHDRGATLLKAPKAGQGTPIPPAGRWQPDTDRKPAGSARGTRNTGTG